MEKTEEYQEFLELYDYFKKVMVNNFDEQKYNRFLELYNKYTKLTEENGNK